jgi:TRAP-type mannitol/chloroaromatic compound transport system permease small subunit
MAAMMLSRLASALDRLIGAIVAGASLIAVPVVALLFLQWPLRDLVQAHSREANDLGQWLFALYVAIAVTAATRAHTHLATDVVAHHYAPRTRDILARAGVLLGVLPWGLFVIVAGRNLVLSSLLGRETFPDTTNPGYFLVKLALWLLAGLMLAQGVVDLVAPRREPHP